MWCPHSTHTRITNSLLSHFLPVKSKILIFRICFRVLRVHNSNGLWRLSIRSLERTIETANFNTKCAYSNLAYYSIDFNVIVVACRFRSECRSHPHIHTYTLMLYIAAAPEMKHLQIFWILHNLTASNKSFLHIGIMAIDLVSWVAVVGRCCVLCPLAAEDCVLRARTQNAKTKRNISFCLCFSENGFASRCVRIGTWSKPFFGRQQHIQRQHHSQWSHFCGRRLKLKPTTDER